MTGTLGVSQSIIEVGEANVSQFNLPLGYSDLSLLTSILASVPSKSKITVFCLSILTPFKIFACVDRFKASTRYTGY